MMTTESEAARRERESCPVCASAHRRTVDRMRRAERATYGDIRRYFESMDEDVSLRWIMRHFGRAHDLLVADENGGVPAWVFEDEAELVRFTEAYGYCRTIDDLCPHVPARTASDCETVDHPECARFRRATLRERLLDVETRAPVPAAAAGGAPHTLVEPLILNQIIEVESRSGPRRGIYASTVLALESAAIAISVPTRLAEMLPLAPGDRVSVSYQGRVSKYNFETTVQGIRENRVEIAHPAAVSIASRRSPRIPLRDSAVRVVRIERGGDELTGSAANVSQEGLRLILASELVHWERVRITVALADGPLTAEAEVVRVEMLASGAVAHGMYFTGLSPEDQARLQRLGG
ncbi:MAG TPA: flagellar brake protein [bacterium]|nr:flagellar brake protein [bacterium]